VPTAATSTVGIIVNPHAGKDIRRLVSAAGQTSDAVKISIVRRVAVGALEQGADRIVISRDSHRLGERAVEGLGGNIEFVDSPGTGSHLDTIAAAREMWKEDVGAVVALGGDGTCRDVATGWPDAPLIAISTGTNNVFPEARDGTTAGVAAALVASRLVDPVEVTTPAKRVSLQIDDPQRSSAVHEDALVEAALVDTPFVGARAVADPSAVRWIAACIATPSGTGLSSVAGRVHPVGRNDPGGVLIRTGEGGRRVRVPLSPGEFTTVNVASVEPLDDGATVELPGGGVLAYDGERTTPLSREATVTVTIERSGPHMIDIDRTLLIAAHAHRFDVAPDQVRVEDETTRKDTHGN
jgi:hypothetical protein